MDFWSPFALKIGSLFWWFWCPLLLKQAHWTDWWTFGPLFKMLGSFSLYFPPRRAHWTVWWTTGRSEESNPGWLGLPSTWPHLSGFNNNQHLAGSNFGNNCCITQCPHSRKKLGLHWVTDSEVQRAVSILILFFFNYSMLKKLPNCPSCPYWEISNCLPQIGLLKTNGVGSAKAVYVYPTVRAAILWYIGEYKRIPFFTRNP